MFTVKALAYSQVSKDWTDPVEFVARTEVEAKDWVRFNKDWMKGFEIISPAITKS
jgi:hypothetical protein